MSAPSDDEQDQLCLALYRASHAMTALYRDLLEPLDLTYPQFTVLSTLGRTGSATVRALALVLDSDYGTVSPLLQRLEAKGLVLRARSDSDQREVLVKLTTEGRRVQRRARTVPRRIRDAVDLTDPAHDRLVDELHRLTDQLRSPRP